MCSRGEGFDCYDGDEGYVNPATVQAETTVVYTNGTEIVKTDTCDGDVLLEYSCGLEGIVVTEIGCGNGCDEGICLECSQDIHCDAFGGESCVDGDCVLECEIDEDCLEGEFCKEGFCEGVSFSPVTCEYSCEYRGECIQMYDRIKGQYCNPEFEMEEQKPDEVDCEFASECLSGVCLGQCTDAGFFVEMIRWLRHFFGIDWFWN